MRYWIAKSLELVNKLPPDRRHEGLSLEPIGRSYIEPQLPL